MGHAINGKRRRGRPTVPIAFPVRQRLTVQIKGVGRSPRPRGNAKVRKP